MSATEDLLRKLSADLKPVRRIPPLHVSGAVVLALWLLAVECEWQLGGARPGFGELGRWHDPIYDALFAGLVAAAGAGLVATLAHRAPGRESLARGASAVAALGALLAIGAAAAQWWMAGPGAMAGTAPAWGCVLRSATLGVIPALVAAWLLRGSWRPGGGMWVPLFAAPLGAIAVHASCVAGGAEHMLLGHALGPLLVGTSIAAGWWGTRVLRTAS